MHQTIAAKYNPQTKTISMYTWELVKNPESLVSWTIESEFALPGFPGDLHEHERLTKTALDYLSEKRSSQTRPSTPYSTLPSHFTSYPLHYISSTWTSHSVTWSVLGKIQSLGSHPRSIKSELPEKGLGFEFLKAS